MSEQKEEVKKQPRTKDELIEAQREKLQELKDILEAVKQGPVTVGKIVAGPDETGVWRVDAEREGGDSLILPSDIQENLREPLAIGKKVMYSKDIILNVLPEVLEVKADPPQFDFIEWSAIGGMKSQISRIRDAVENPIKHKELYKQLNIPPIKGLLLYGKPGCGKTLIAKAIASTLLKEMKEIDHDSFIYVKGAEILAPLVGVAEQRIRTFFHQARSHSKRTGHPSVIFIDEAEAILNKRGSRVSSDVDKTIVPTFLSEMDGFEGNPPFIILSTNMASELDPAVVRAGRIDLHIEIAKPTLEDAVDIFRVHLSTLKILDADIEELSRVATEALFARFDPTGADIATIITRAGELAISRKVANPKSKLAVIEEDVLHSIQQATHGGKRKEQH